MKKRAFLAATALIASSFVTVSTPALALDVDPDDQAAMDEFCTDELKPNTQSGFYAYAEVTGSEEITTNVGPEYDPHNFEGLPPGIPFGGTAFGVPASELTRNGNSPNLFATVPADGIRYADSSYWAWQDTETSTRYTLNCIVTKDTPGNDPFPPGLQNQVFISSNVIEDTIEVFHATGGGEYIDDADGETTQVVVCISPNSTTKGKPGDWKIQNGWTGTPEECTTRSNQLNGESLPNLNAPTT